MRDTQRERGRDTGRGRSRLHAGSTTQDSIPGLQDRAPGQRQALNPGIPDLFIYLFMIDTERERGRDTGGGRSRLQAGSPTQDSIPGLQGSRPGAKGRN